MSLAPVIAVGRLPSVLVAPGFTLDCAFVWVFPQIYFSCVCLFLILLFY